MSSRSRRHPEGGLPPRRRHPGLLLAGPVLLLAACGPNATPVVPPEANPFAEAGAAFASGDFETAANGYRRALSVPDPGVEVDREESLYRLSLIHALPESPLHDPERARTFLDSLLEEFPASSLAVELRSLLELQSVITGLNSTIATMRSTIAELESREAAETQTAAGLQAQVDDLRMRLEAAESELETLRAIDRGRRPRN